MRIEKLIWTNKKSAKSMGREPRYDQNRSSNVKFDRNLTVPKSHLRKSSILLYQSSTSFAQGVWPYNDSIYFTPLYALCTLYSWCLGTHGMPMGAIRLREHHVHLLMSDSMIHGSHASMHPCMHKCMDPRIHGSMNPCVTWIYGSIDP